MVQAFEIVRPQPQLGTKALQLLGEPTEVLPAVAVAGGDLDPRPQEHLDQRRIGHANTDNGDGFSLESR